MAIASSLSICPRPESSLVRCSSSAASSSSRPLPSTIRFHHRAQGFRAPRSRRVGFLPVLRATLERATNDQLQKIEGADDEVCELVSRLELTLGEGDDAINAYLVKAMKNNNGVAVLLLTDVYGYGNNDTRDFAYQLSCFGYNVLVPDLFQGMPWNSVLGAEKFEEWRAKHPPERVAKHIDTASSWLLEEMDAAGVKQQLGLVGFCFGGGRALETLARDTSHQFATAVLFYPTRVDVAIATQVKVPVLLISGDKDELCAADLIQSVAAKIEGSQARVYAMRGHAFAHHPTTPEEDEDAEDAFSTMKTWFHEKLLSQGT